MIYIGIILTLTLIADCTFRYWVYKAEDTRTQRALDKLLSDFEKIEESKNKEAECLEFDCDWTPSKPKAKKKSKK